MKIPVYVMIDKRTQVVYHVSFNEYELINMRGSMKYSWKNYEILTKYINLEDL